MGFHVSQKAAGGRTRPSPNINVTPLVDVTLVVLIIFMVVTPLMTKTFWLNLPKQDEKEKPEPRSPDEANKPLVLTVDEKGTIRVNQTILSPSELEQRLPRMIAANRQKVVYFDAHDDLPYGKAVKVMDASRVGGARSIAILTQKLVH
jgi:biopolymer transport protein ExbD/biopolymer transport protein TolR